MSARTFLPFATPDVGEAEIAAVSEAIRSGWLTSGPKAAEFERQFAGYVQAPHALGVNSCTAGLHLALAALGVGPGDEVVTSPVTFCATVNVILELGAKPVLADIGPDLNIDPDCLADVISPRTKAVIPVHMAGLPCLMDSIWRVAERYGLKVVEDAAHACGACYRGVPVGGGRSDAVAFSFYATKNLCTGEGGMVTSSSADLNDKMRILCLHGISRDAWNRYSEKGNWYYEVVDCGFKYNMSDLLAAIGISQLRRLEQMNRRRAEIVAVYKAAFAGMRELELPPDRMDSRHAWHLFVLRLNLACLTINRAQFIEQMKERGIGCSVHFIPIPLHPYYSRRLEMRDPCSRALAEYGRLVSLPLYSKMSNGDVDRVVKAVRDVVGQSRRRVSVFQKTQTVTDGSARQERPDAQ